jgi:ABC-type glycerol-3-phosphate transport system substrate-binding protein
MKNSFKLGALALVLSLSVVACGGNKSTSTVDSTKVTTVDTTAKADTTKKDSAATTTTTTTVKTDSTKKM